MTQAPMDWLRSASNQTQTHPTIPCKVRLHAFGTAWSENKRIQDRGAQEVRKRVDEAEDTTCVTVRIKG